MWNDCPPWWLRYFALWTFSWQLILFLAFPSFLVRLWTTYSSAIQFFHIQNKTFIKFLIFIEKNPCDINIVVMPELFKIFAESRMKEFLSGFCGRVFFFFFFFFFFFWALSEYESILRFFFSKGKKITVLILAKLECVKPFIELKFPNWLFSISFIPVWIFL